MLLYASIIIVRDVTISGHSRKISFPKFFALRASLGPLDALAPSKDPLLKFFYTKFFVLVLALG